MKALLSIVVLVIISTVFAGCAPQAAPAVEPTPALADFSLPEGITFQLPEGFDWAGNAGWLSPDGGTSWIGLRQAWVMEGMALDENAGMLHNEDVEILKEGYETIGGIETAVITLKAYSTIAATGERKFVGYERIWAFPAPDGKVLAGVFTQAQSEAALYSMDDAAHTMLASLRWP